MNHKMEDGGFEIITPKGFHGINRPSKRGFSKKTNCDRCGDCCRKGSPSLMKEDLNLFVLGILSYENTYTIRPNEPVISIEDNSTYESYVELIKINDKGLSTACFFYDNEEGCTIYEKRPIQCRKYICWDHSDVIIGLQQNALNRADIFGSVEVVMEIIKKHEEKCSYEKLSRAFERLSSNKEEAIEDIIDMLQYDTYIRPFIEERLNIPKEATNLILGRPLIETINVFGFKVVKEGEDYILLPM